MSRSLNEFEARLLEAERHIRENAPFAVVFRAAAAAMTEIAGVTGCAAWVSIGDGPVRLGVDGSCGEHTTAYPNAVAAFLTSECQTKSLPLRELDRKLNGVLLITPVRLTEDHLAALEVRTASDKPAEPLLREAAAAVTDCLAEAFRNVMLDDFRVRLKTSNALLSLCHRLYECQSRDAFAIAAATELRSLLNVDRVAVLRKHNGHWTIAAVSGVDTVDESSPICRAILQSAESILSSSDVDSWICARTAPTAKSSASSARDVSGESLRTLALSGTSQVRIVPLVSKGDTNPVSSATQAPACLVLELFGDTTPPDEPSVALVRHQLSLASARHFADRPSLLGRLGNRRTILLTALLMAALVMLVVRTDFEIEVTGQLFPDDRYRVFSPHDGTVEELSVDNESAVSTGQNLVRVRNPDLDLQLQQTAGNLETERVRLTSIQRSRTVSSSASGTLSLDQILGGESAVKQRITDLEQRMKLLTEQREGLTVQAQSDGIVYRANLKEELLSRPVRRGDFLFEVIPRNSAWHMELHIPDDVVGYVQQARAGQSSSLPVRFSCGCRRERRGRQHWNRWKTPLRSWTAG
ncbi:MAG: biotin/lipoyl-binding protein [Planctomycetaceae bacterium]